MLILNLFEVSRQRPSDLLCFKRRVYGYGAPNVSPLIELHVLNSPVSGDALQLAPPNWGSSTS